MPVFTQPIPAPVDDVPWLEPYPSQGHLPQRIAVDRLPFTIGRNESCDLAVDSFRVSREHARIFSEGGGYQIEDLKSTNGTFVNGRQIDCAELADGDILTFADLEYGFFHPSPTAAGRMVTQPLRGARNPAPLRPSAADLIAAARRMNEMLLRGNWIRFERIEDLGRGGTRGYRLLAEGENPAWAPAAAEQMILNVDCRLTARLRVFYRRLAVESSARLPDGAVLFIPLAPAELGAEQLLERMASLREGLALGRRLAVELPAGALPGGDAVVDLLRGMSELEVGFACEWRQGRQWLEAEAEGPLPGWLKVHGISASAARSAARSEALLPAIRQALERGVEVIAEGLRTPDDAALALEWGCELGRGPLFGPAQQVAPWYGEDEALQPTLAVL